MKSNSIFYLAGNGLIFVVLVIICFLCANFYTPLFWCSLCFMFISYVIQIGVNIKATQNGEGVKYYFFNLPVTYLSITYTIIASIAGLIFAIPLNLFFKTGFLVQLLIFAFYVVYILMASAGRNTLYNNDKKRAENRSYMIKVSAELIAIEGMTEDRRMKGKIHSLYEAAKMSNPLNAPELYETEADISDKVKELRTEVNNTEKADILIKEIKSLIEQRNSICKSL